MQQCVRTYRCTVQTTHCHAGEGATGSTSGGKRNGKQEEGGKQKLKERGGLWKRERRGCETDTERERAAGSMLEWNSRASGAAAGFNTRSFSVTRSDGASEGRKQECGGEVVIKGETEGGVGEISVDEQRLAFNRKEIKEVWRERRGDVTSTPWEQKRSKEDRPKACGQERKEKRNGAFLWVPGNAGGRMNLVSACMSERELFSLLVILRPSETWTSVRRRGTYSSASLFPPSALSVTSEMWGGDSEILSDSQSRPLDDKVSRDTGGDR